MSAFALLDLWNRLRASVGGRLAIEGTGARGALLAITLALSACGGAGESEALVPPPQPPVAVPSFSITGASAQVETGSPMSLASTGLGDRTGFSYRWDFGDGTSSTLPTAEKSYATPGNFQLSLTITGAGGDSRTASAAVVSGRFSLVEDMRCTGDGPNTGWCGIKTLPVSGGNLHFVDGLHGWIVGSSVDFFDARAIYRTADGGVTWTRHATGAPAPFNYLQFANPDRGIGLIQVYDEFVLLRTEVWATEDGGRTWRLRSTLAIPSPCCTQSVVFFLAPLFISSDGLRVILQGNSTGVSSVDGGFTWTQTPFSRPVVTPAGTVWQLNGNDVLRSEDMGLSYTRTRLAHADEQLQMMSVFGERHGFVVGRSPSGAVSIWRTGDAGSTWTRSPSSPLPFGTGALTVMAAHSQDVLWLRQHTSPGGFTSATSRSTDGGLSWQPVVIPGVDPSATQLVNFTKDYAAVTLATETACEIRWSSDGGMSWKSTPAARDGGACGGFLPLDPSARTYLSSIGTRTFVTVDSGASFKHVLGLTAAQSVITDTQVVWFFDEKRWDNLRSSTVDGGRVWTLKPQASWPAAGGFIAPRVQFADRNLGWSMTDGANNLNRTANGGQTWQTIQLPAAPGFDELPGFEERWRHIGADLHFIDDRRGWVARSKLTPGTLPGNSLGAVWSTSDGGLTWAAQPKPPLAPLSVFFLNASVGFIAGANGHIGLFGYPVSAFEPTSGGIAQTQDGGQTWQMRVTGLPSPLTRIYFVDATRGYALGQTGAVLRTIDAGVTWQSVTLPTTRTARDIRFANADRGWIIGDGGLLLATTDGGATWTAQTVPTSRDLMAIFVSDTHTVSVVDDRGRPFITATGGR